MALHLIISQVDTSFLEVTECDSFEWNGVLYYESGSYIYETQSLGGCDSIAILNLTINYSDESYEEITACDSFNWNGITYNSSGIYTFLP